MLVFSRASDRFAIAAAALATLALAFLATPQARPHHRVSPQHASGPATVTPCHKARGDSLQAMYPAMLIVSRLAPSPTIERELGVLATRMAVVYMTSGRYDDAARAVIVAERAGVSTETTAAIRAVLADRRR